MDYLNVKIHRFMDLALFIFTGSYFSHLFVEKCVKNQAKKWTKNKLVHTVHRNSRKSDIRIHGPDIHIHGPNIHIYIIFMDMAIYEFKKKKVHTAHEIL